MRLRIVKLDPNGNITLLVTSPVPREMQAITAARLMSGDGLRVREYRAGTNVAHGNEVSGSALLRDVEQVGFVENSTMPGTRARLQMMGGEFCGNASMAMAALFAARDGLTDGTDAQMELEVSGATQAVHCKLQRLDSSNFLGSVTMPLPEAIGEAILPDETCVPMVRFPGITHLIIPEGKLNNRETEVLIPGLCAGLKADALGMLFTNAEATTMRPLVYVRKTDSCVWERGCGSGTAAIGVWKANQARATLRLVVSQPGGAIAVRATYQGNAITALEIEGRVSITAAGMIEMDM